MRLLSAVLISASATVSAASLVNSPDAFYSALQPCPAPCKDTPESWTVYPSVDRLQICGQPMLLDFSIYNSLSNHATAVRLRTCTSGNANDTTNALLANAHVSSKRSTITAPSACMEAKESSLSLDLIISAETGTSSGASLQAAMSSLQQELASQTQCDTNFLAAYSNGSVVGIYSGAAIENSHTVPAILKQLLNHVRASDGPNPETMLVQVCGEGRNANYVFGVAVSTTGDLAAVQEAIQTWSNGTCVQSSAYSTRQLGTVSIYEAPLIPNVPVSNSTIMSNITRLAPRSDCTTVTVVSGDSCASLAAECGISGATFETYNPGVCSSLAPGQRVCCTAGTLPDIAPQPYSNGTCFTYTVQSLDSCAKIAAANGITVTQLEDFNNGAVWGWNGCSGLDVGINICLSSGNPPLPAPAANALCGPTVPGTAPPAGNHDISSLNPCPLNACCDIWGQCGTTSDFCTPAVGPTGNPGTAPAGQNGCISNCGTAIVNNANPPASFKRVTYYESWNWQRPCLNYPSAQLGATNYTHVHWGFATINSDFSVEIEDDNGQLSDFLQLPMKKIVSFGGWGFSTSTATYDILRSAMDPANVDTFVTNVINYINAKGFDGVDIDWEYPGAPDIPGIPQGLATDGPNYLAFLQKLRAALPSGKLLSIAAPASYWYLKAFPIAQMAQELDYMVFMTYDLHGQWDYGNAFSQPGCPAGDCLRSHVNLTETLNALSMLTKAGVQANQVLVGVASYGRSFGMKDPAACESSIDDPQCVFGGPDSTAQPGACTQTAGYIANGELDQFPTSEIIYKFDTSSDSDTIIYSSTWVAYMSDSTKSSRISKYQGLNFGGSVDWAVDLQGPGAFEDTGSTTPTQVQIPTIAGCPLGPDGTLTITLSCVTPIIQIPPSGADNTPPGPDECWTDCDLNRLLTRTCCGLGGSLGTGIVIESGVPVPAQLGLPAGFTPSSSFQDANGTTYPASTALDKGVTIDSGFTFNDPFKIPVDTPFVVPGDVSPYYHATPASVSIIPLPCTTVPPLATFTLTSDCAPGILSLPVGTEQNNPPGPASCKSGCSLLRILTGTCCGSDSALANAIIIAAGVATPFDLILPTGFVMPIDAIINGFGFAAGDILAFPLLVPAGIVFGAPFLIPLGTEIEEDDDDEWGGQVDILTLGPGIAYTPTIPALATETMAQLDIALILAEIVNTTIDGGYTGSPVVAPSPTINWPTQGNGIASNVAPVNPTSAFPTTQGASTPLGTLPPTPPAPSPSTVWCKAEMSAIHSYGIDSGAEDGEVNNYVFGLEVWNSANKPVFSYTFDNSLGDITYTVSASSWQGPGAFTVKTGYDSGGSVFTSCEWTYGGSTTKGDITSGVTTGLVSQQWSNCDILLACN